MREAEYSQDFISFYEIERISAALALFPLKIPYNLLYPPLKSSLVGSGTWSHRALLLLLSQAGGGFHAIHPRSRTRALGPRAARHRAGGTIYGWKWNWFSFLGLFSHTRTTASLCVCDYTCEF